MKLKRRHTTNINKKINKSQMPIFSKRFAALYIFNAFLIKIIGAVRNL